MRLVSLGPGRGTLYVGGQVVAEFRILSMEIEVHKPDPPPPAPAGIQITVGRSAVVRPSKPPENRKGTGRRTAQWKRETKGYRP